MRYLPLTELLTEIVDNRGRSVPTVDKGFPLIATNCIKHTSIYPTFEKVRYVSEETLRTWFRAHLKPNDILFVNKGTPGRVCLVPDPVTFCAAQDMMAFRCNPEIIDYRYLFAVLRSSEIQKKIANNHVGLVIPHFRKQELAELIIPVPERSTQESIGSIYIDLSRKIEINNRINAELEAMAKSIYDYWFVQFDFPISKEQAKAMGKPKLEGKPYKASGGKMVWNEEMKREAPEGWEFGVINDLGEIVGGSTPSTNDSENFQVGGTPWITPKDLSLIVGKKFITRGEVSVSEKGIQNASLKIMPKGTILLSSRAPIGYMAIAREAVTSNQGFKNLVPNKGYSSEVVYYTVKNLLPVIERNASGSTFKEISGSVLKSIKVLLPPRELANSLTEKLTPIFRKQNILELENEKLAELRDWLLPMLMNGQVKVKEVAQSTVKPELSLSKPANSYFYQTQLVAAIVNASKKNKITHGEMTLAKYTYLVDKLYGVPTYFNYERLHLGPYPKEMKKIVNNKKFFKIQDNEVSVVPQEKQYNYQFQKQVEEAVADLASIFNQYKGQERSHQTELLATVCKVVEDIKSTELKLVRESMKNWPIDLKTSKFKNKAEKFGEEETAKLLRVIVTKGWNVKLAAIKTN